MTGTSSIVVITDLDGTLLDHHTYSYEAALPGIDALKKHRIPLVFSSSKTAAEILALREQLGVTDPFVVENGAAVYLSDTPTPEITFAQKRQEILEIIHRLRTQQQYNFIGFADMTIEEIQSSTGLEIKAAMNAMKRDFSEPLLWRQSDSHLDDFCDRLSLQNLHTQRGGRFVHVQGEYDKSDAMAWLRNYYHEKWSTKPWVVALGDSENDKRMLETADEAVLVRSPVHHLPVFSHDRLTITNQVGPKGWNDAILSLLQKHESEGD